MATFKIINKGKVSDLNISKVKEIFKGDVILTGGFPPLADGIEKLYTEKILTVPTARHICKVLKIDTSGDLHGMAKRIDKAINKV